MIFLKLHVKDQAKDKKEWQMSMSKKVDYDAPIKFKNVSLTMGM